MLTEKVLLPQEIQHVKGLAGVLRVFVGRSFELVRLSLGTRLGVIHPEVVDEERHGCGRGRGRSGRKKRRRFRPVVGDLGDRVSRTMKTMMTKKTITIGRRCASSRHRHRCLSVIISVDEFESVI